MNSDGEDFQLLLEPDPDDTEDRSEDGVIVYYPQTADRMESFDEIPADIIGAENLSSILDDSSKSDKAGDFLIIAAVQSTDNDLSDPLVSTVLDSDQCVPSMTSKEFVHEQNRVQHQGEPFFLSSSVTDLDKKNDVETSAILETMKLEFSEEDVSDDDYVPSDNGSSSDEDDEIPTKERRKIRKRKRCNPRTDPQRPDNIPLYPAAETTTGTVVKTSTDPSMFMVNKPQERVLPTNSRPDSINGNMGQDEIDPVTSSQTPKDRPGKTEKTCLLEIRDSDFSDENLSTDDEEPPCESSASDDEEPESNTSAMLKKEHQLRPNDHLSGSEDDDDYPATKISRVTSGNVRDASLRVTEERVSSVVSKKYVDAQKKERNWQDTFLERLTGKVVRGIGSCAANDQKKSNGITKNETTEPVALIDPHLGQSSSDFLNTKSRNSGDAIAIQSKEILSDMNNDRNQDGDMERNSHFQGAETTDTEFHDLLSSTALGQDQSSRSEEFGSHSFDEQNQKQQNPSSSCTEEHEDPEELRGKHPLVGLSTDDENLSAFGIPTDKKREGSLSSSSPLTGRDSNEDRKKKRYCEQSPGLADTAGARRQPDSFEVREDQIFQEMLQEKASLPSVPLPAATTANDAARPQNPNVWSQVVPKSNKAANYQKLNYCSHCEKLFSRIDRHMVRIHRNLPEVLDILAQEERSKTRLLLFERLKFKMNHVWNNDREKNPTGIMLVSRRSCEHPIKRSKNATKTKDVIKPRPARESCGHVPEVWYCKFCEGYFRWLGQHIRNKHPEKVNENARTRDLRARAFAQMAPFFHPRANLEIVGPGFSEMRLDEVSATARNDLSLVLFAIKHFRRYKEKKERVFVKNGLRLMGKILIGLRKKSKKIQKYDDATHARFWELWLEVIQEVAKYDKESNRYQSIYNAEQAPIFLRKLFKTMECEFMRSGQDQKRTDLNTFRHVFEEEVVYQTAYLATKSRKDQVRRVEQVEIEPGHFKIFLKFVNEKREKSLAHFKEIRDSYDPAHYMTLLKTSAVDIESFNGRRPEETGATLLDNYLNAKTPDVNSEYFQMLSEEEQKQRLKYKRIDMQGKKLKGDGHLFISEKNEECLKTLIRFRAYFGIPKNNKYLFAIPTRPGEEGRHLDLGPVYAKLANECKIIYPEINANAIRPNKVRHHHATLHGVMTGGAQPAAMATQLGHTVSTHVKWYKQRVPKDDVIVTRELEKFAGQLSNASMTPKIDENAGALESSANEVPTFDSSAADCGRLTPPVGFESGAEDDEPPRKKKNVKPKIKSVKVLEKQVKIKRDRWTNEEKDAFNMAFQSQLAEGRTASSAEMMAAQEKYPILKNRPLSTLRVKFSNEKKKMK